MREHCLLILDEEPAKLHVLARLLRLRCRVASVKPGRRGLADRAAFLRFAGCLRHASGCGWR
jgi:hypothetical protein